MRRLALSVLVSLAACSSSSTRTSNDASAPPLVDGGTAVDAATDAAVPGASRLGANVEPGGVAFRVWAPDATAVKVNGNFAQTAMTSIGDGVWEAHVAGAKAGDDYAFAITSSAGTLSRTDPWCRLYDGSQCHVVDPSAYPWKATSFVRPARSASVVYELHVGSFSVASGESNGTFTSLAAALPQLADLGIDVVELMPIQDFGGGAEGWGYNPQLYFAPKPTYGTPDELRALVDAAHGLGIAVWIDSVINHMDGYAAAPLRCFDTACGSDDNGIYFFPAGVDATTPYGPRPDYATPQVANMLLGSAQSFLDEMHGDGFRWDSVSNIRAIDGSGTVPGGRDLLVSINQMAHARGALSVAEDLKGDANITADPSTGGFGFDAQWDGFGYDVVGELLKTDANRNLGNIEGAITSAPNGDAFSRLLYTETHDSVGNGGSHLPNQIDPGSPTSLLARKLSMLGSTLLLTTPGIPMLFEGQEQLALGTFVDPPLPLAAATTQGLAVRAFYKDLIRLRRNLDGHTGGLTDANVEVFHRNDTAKVMAYRRYGASGQDVVVIVNLANKAYAEYDIGVTSAGPWTVRLDLDSTTYGSDFPAGQTGSIIAHAAAKDGKAYTLPLQLGAYSAMVLSK